MGGTLAGRLIGCLCVFLSFSLISCARPKDTAITEFANSTAALSSLAKTTGELNAELDGKANLAAAAKSYAETNHITFPPGKGILLGGKSDADWKAVEGFLDAISAYATALAKANDPALVTGLSNQVSTLGTSVSKLVAANAAASDKVTQQRVELIGGIVAGIVRIAADLYATHEIRSAIERTQSILADSRQPLRTAIKAVQIVNQTRLETYRRGLVEKLRLASTDLNATQRYQLYVMTAAEYEAVVARVEAMKDLDKAIEAMIKAHGELLATADNRAALIAFLATVADIADKINKANSLAK